jgi:VWFA-related protein
MKLMKNMKNMKERFPGVPAFMIFMSFMVVLLANAAGQQQVFRTRVEVVQLDVSVLDKHRRPVRGLTQDDFTILEDGKPQKIVGFSAFEIDDAPAPVVGWMRDVPPDVTTNALKDSRLFVMVLDDAMIPQEAAFIRDSKKIAASIIEKLGPDDLTAIVFTGDNRKSQDFTNDKTKLLAALDNFNPGLAGYRFGLDAMGVDVDHWFYQSSIRTLGNIADFLISVPGKRKALFWVSPGVPMDPLGCRPIDPAEMPATGPKVCVPATLPSADVVEMQQRTDEVFRRAQRANVTIYPVDPTGLGGLRAYVSNRLGAPNQFVAAHKVAMSQDFLAAAAANTGGRTVMNTNDFEPGLTDVFAENSSYYLIGFEPANVANDGKLRRIEVKVNHPDADVRTRSGYYAPDPEKPNTRKAALSPEAEALGNAIGGLLPDAGLPMKVSVAPFAVPGQRLATVTVVLGVRQPVPEAAAKSRITETTELLTSAFTPEGDPRGTQRHTARVVLRAGADGEAVYEVLGRIDLAPGRYRLRLAAHNATAARTGSVFADVVVPDYSNAVFSATPIVLSVAPGRVSAPRDLFSTLLPLVPTAERTFAASDKVTAFLRIYQSGQKPIVPARVTISVRDAKNEVKATETHALAADQFRTAGQEIMPAQDALPPRRPPPGMPTPTAGDRFANLSLRTADIRYALPFARLTPGEHLLTVEIVFSDSTLRRDVRFQVR